MLQLDKEGLAIVFHHYLLGCKFTIYSDYQPLKYLFSENKAIPAMASARIQHWELTLSAYDYDIVFKPDSQHANADVLNRLPLPDHPTSIPLPQDTVLLMEALQMSPILQPHRLSPGQAVTQSYPRYGTRCCKDGWTQETHSATILTSKI